MSEKEKYRNIMFQCVICEKQFTRKHNLTRHAYRIHKRIPSSSSSSYQIEVPINENVKRCRVCHLYGKRPDMVRHLSRHLLSSKFFIIETAFNRRVKTYQRIFKNISSINQLELIVEDILLVLQCELSLVPSLKFCLVAISNVFSEIYSEDTIKSENFVQRIKFRQISQILLRKEVKKTIVECLNELKEREESLRETGSGWQIFNVEKLNIEIAHLA